MMDEMHLLSFELYVCLSFVSIFAPSEALDAIFLQASVLRYISIELVCKTLVHIFEVLPGALGSDLESALRVSCPAVEPPIVEVVRVSIMDLLNPVVARPVKPALALECLRPAPALIIVRKDVPPHINWQEVEQSHEGDRHVVFGQLADDEVPLEGACENAGVGGLCEVELIIARQTMVSHNSLESTFHV